MTHIDFYILANNLAPNSRELFACRLSEKAFHLGHKIYIHTESRSHSSLMDDLLWTFKQGSFLPHAFISESSDSRPAILIGHDTEPQQHMDVLLNLSQEVPLFFSRFERVAEFIDEQEDNKIAGRERFRFYKDRGYSLKSHQLNV